MLFRNLGMLLRMGSSPNIWRFIHKMRSFFRPDPAYSFFRLTRAALNTLKGEKIVKHENEYIITSFLPPIPSRAFDSVASAVPEPTNPYTQQMTARRRAPVSIFCEVTARCFFNCRHCSSAERTHATELSTSQWLDIIRALQDMGTAIIGFTGGEPLLRADLSELISALDDRSVSILYTNGSLLGAEKAKKLKASGLFAVGISLDSRYEEVHNKSRGVDDAFNRAVAAVGHAAAAGLYPFVQRVVMPGDLDEKELSAFFQFAGEIGAKEVRLLEPIPCGRLLTKEDAFFFTPAQRERLKALQYRINGRWGFPKITTFAHTESMAQFGCGAGTQHSYISSSGELFPCDFTPLSFGKVTEQDVKSLWQEMNERMGVPKSHCFAMDLAGYARNHPEISFPVDRQTAEAICRSHKATTYPRFYRLLQGKAGKTAPLALD